MPEIEFEPTNGALPPRSHLWGCLGPALLGLAIAVVALSSVGLGVAALLALFGVDPITSLTMVVLTDRGTAAGLAGAACLTIAMWAAHLADRRMGWVWWVAAGVIGYAIGALAVTALVAQTTPA